MLFRHTITIEPDTVPKDSQDICCAVAKYCAQNDLYYEFECRGYPVIARIGQRKYAITKQFVRRFRVNLWVLRCREIK